MRGAVQSDRTGRRFDPDLVYQISPPIPYPFGGSFSFSIRLIISFATAFVAPESVRRCARVKLNSSASFSLYTVAFASLVLYGSYSRVPTLSLLHGELNPVAELFVGEDELHPALRSVLV
jgi:Na+/proline symporter